MPTSQQAHPPALHLHQSSPTPAINDSSSMLAQSAYMGGGWNDFNGAYLSALPKAFKDQRYHKRGSSGSSVASAGPPSPLTQNTIYPQIATSEATFSPSYDFDFTQQTTPHTAKSLPASATDASIMFPRSSAYGAVDMRRIRSQGTDERASYPQSVSTVGHNSPATPHTNYEPEFDVESKNVFGEDYMGDGSMSQYLQFDAGYPAVAASYPSALQEVFPDHTQYQPTAMAFRPQQQQAMRMAQVQRQTMMADRLQAAQQDHLQTHSPTSNPREKSPFQASSPFNMAATLARPQPPQLHKARTSISPKELMLDEHDIDEPNQTPLFANQSQPMFSTRPTPSSLSQFYTPSFNTEPTVQIPQQYPFVSRPDSQTSMSADVTPDFHAPLLSMESTVEEIRSASSSQQSLVEPKSHQVTPVRMSQRPVDTSSDSGTYSCTYHGCALRFETPAKLQKHKREGHRQVSPTTGSSSPNTVARNSQAGPHRCDRINPTTGKPCNSIFSRPYDLTRHEDTIHNARKQKVRCHLCTEEKTFSRNDALTRHMRVVHPDVDWVGKQKRRSQR